MLSWLATNYLSKPVWGDGFVDDNVFDILASIDIEYVAPEELFRYLPGLARGDRGVVAREIRRIFEAHLEDVVLRKVEPDARIDEEGRACVERLLETADWRAAPFRERDAALVAFFTGVHPAFIWREALLSHDRFAAFAWLGHAFQNQRAYLPREVAIYFLDVLTDEGGTVACADRVLAEFVPLQADTKRLRRCADRCRKASSAVFVQRRRRTFGSSLRRGRE